MNKIYENTVSPSKWISMAYNEIKRWLLLESKYCGICVYLLYNEIATRKKKNNVYCFMWFMYRIFNLVYLCIDTQKKIESKYFSQILILP